MSSMTPLQGSLPPEIAGLFFLLGLGFVIAIGLLNSRDKTWNGILRRVAVRVGGTLVEGGLFGESRIDFAIAGRGASLQFFGGSRGNSPYSRVLLDIRGLSAGTLHILEDGFAQFFLKMFGAQDLLIGDASFDEDYVIKATPESLAARIFSPARRSEVIRTVRRLRGFADPSFDLDENYLSVVVRQYLRDETALNTLITAATEFLGHVTALSTPRGVELGEVKIAAEGHCPVCGTGLREPLARCERCRTPHHGECWSYLGRCATYACRGTRSQA
jgi:hypothetical protein